MQRRDIGSLVSDLLEVPCKTIAVQIQRDGYFHTGPDVECSCLERAENYILVKTIS